MKQKMGLLFFFFSLWLPSAMAVNQYEVCSNLFRREGNEITDGAFVKAFRTTTKMSRSLMERTLELQQRWPNRIKMIDDVTFKFEHQLASAEKQRKMLAISLKDITPEDEILLKQDYEDYLSWNAVAFPLNEKGGHLHTRIGSYDLDYYGSMSHSAYRFPSQRRLESIVSLTDTEFTNLRQYIHNIETLGDTNVLGRTTYQGVTDEIPNATLSMNKASTGGHNCTSWISTAPIGEGGETLKSIIGTGGLNVHTNPGWWTSFIQMRSHTNRVPYVIYMSRTEALDTIETSVKGNVFNWDYGLH